MFGKICGNNPFQPGGGRGGHDISHWEISADLLGKEWQGKRENGEGKKKKIEKGKVENKNGRRRKSYKMRREIFLKFIYLFFVCFCFLFCFVCWFCFCVFVCFFFFVFSLFKTTEICLGATKVWIFYREKAFYTGKKIRKSDFAPSEKFSSYAPVGGLRFWFNYQLLIFPDSFAILSTSVSPSFFFFFFFFSQYC